MQLGENEGKNLGEKMGILTKKDLKRDLVK